MNLDDLEQIQRVEAPPFLLSRIREKIAASTRERMPRSGMLVLFSGLALVILMNLFFLFGFGSDGQALQELAQAMELTTSNDLYSCERYRF